MLRLRRQKSARFSWNCDCHSVGLLPERVLLVLVVERPVVFVVRVLVVGMVNEHREPMKMVVPIQFFEPLARRVL